MHKNHLYPIFLRTERLHILIVGGGNVAFEKLHFLLKSSPHANIKLVAPAILPEIREALKNTDAVSSLHERPFEENDLDGIEIALIATNDFDVNKTIRDLAKARNVLVNVADTPSLCDFYLGSIVSKGPLKIGISTNGLSPTTAKRIRQFLESVIPDEIETLIDNLSAYRDQLTTDFKSKVESLNALTSSLVDDDQELSIRNHS